MNSLASQIAAHPRATTRRPLSGLRGLLGPALTLFAAAGALLAPPPAGGQCAKPGRAFGGSVDVGTPRQVVRSAAVADFDLDGLDDFAAHDGPYRRQYALTGTKTVQVNLGIYLNRTPRGALDKTAFTSSIFTLGEETHCYNCAEETDLQAADLNGDGAPDLVASLSANDAVFVLLNDRKGGFLAPVKYPVGKNPVWVRAGDFDGDGIADLATVNLERVLVKADRWSLSFLRGDGTPAGRGTFAPHADLDLGETERLGPVDRNNESPYSMLETSVQVLQLGAGSVLATGDRLFGLRFWTAAGGKLREARFAGSGLGTREAVFGAFDLDKDGFPDLVGTGGFDLTFDLLRSPDSASLAAENKSLRAIFASNRPEWGPLEQILFSDVDRDGSADAMAVFRSAAVVGFGGGTRAAHPFGDFDGNGVRILRVFDHYQRAADAGLRYAPAAFGDFNGDRFQDVLAGPDTRDELSGSLKVYYNQGMGAQARPDLIEIVPTVTKEGLELQLHGSNLRQAGSAAVVFHVATPPEAKVFVPLNKVEVRSETLAVVLVPSLGDDLFWNGHSAAWGMPGFADATVRLKTDCHQTRALPLRVEEDPTRH